MKKYVVYMLLSVAGFFSACGDEGSVNIVSLNTFGSKVCRNDNVKVFVSAETSGEDLPTYEWGCSGGSLTNPPGLFENVWKAPNEPGEYEIWVKVERNGAEDTRRAIITVLDELFYSDFETPYYNEGFSNSDITLSQDTKTGSAKVVASKANALFRRNWSTELGIVPPYSMQMKYKPNKVSANTDYLGFRIAFLAEEGLQKRLDDVNFYVYPKTGEYKVVANYLDNATGSTTSLVAETGQNDIFKTMGVWSYVSVSINESKQFIVYFDGTEILKSSILNNFTESSFLIQGGFYDRSRVVGAISRQRWIHSSPTDVFHFV